MVGASAGSGARRARPGGASLGPEESAAAFLSPPPPSPTSGASPGTHLIGGEPSPSLRAFYQGPLQAAGPPPPHPTQWDEGPRQTGALWWGSFLGLSIQGFRPAQDLCGSAPGHVALGKVHRPVALGEGVPSWSGRQSWPLVLPQAPRAPSGSLGPSDPCGSQSAGQQEGWHAAVGGWHRGRGPAWNSSLRLSPLP